MWRCDDVQVRYADLAMPGMWMVWVWVMCEVEMSEHRLSMEALAQGNVEATLPPAHTAAWNGASGHR